MIASDIFIKYWKQRHKINELFKDCRLETNIWQSKQYIDIVNKFKYGHKGLSINSMIADEKKRMNSFTKRCKKGVETIWNSFRRSISLIDLITDLRLLYLVSIANNPILSFVMVLSVSLVCPYIVSYSCGVKLYFLNHDNNAVKNLTALESHSVGEYVAFKKIIAYLGLSPIGVFYFLCLDLIDILFVYYKLFAVIVLGKNEMEMKMLEEMVAKQLGMTRMNYEGIKRQRAAAMILFETIPQAIIQLLLLINVFGDDDSLEAANVQALDVYLSIIFAVLNSAFQILRLKLESRACNEKFNEYCLECLMARISWIPFENNIRTFLNEKRDNTTNDEPNDDPNVAVTIINRPEGSEKIGYDIKYNCPCGIKIAGYQPRLQLQFDFSSITIQKLISTIRLSKTKTPEKKYLEINFGKSLRLINFQDLMMLFAACLEKNIKIIGFDNVSMVHLLSNAMNISANGGKDVRLLSNCRNSLGKPFISDLFSLENIFGTQGNSHTIAHNYRKQDSLLSTMFECLILNDFNLNANDIKNGETIVFDLIRQNKCQEFLLLLKTFVKEKHNRFMLNYYNYSGVSPLYLAIKHNIEYKNDQKLAQLPKHENKEMEKQDHNQDADLIEIIFDDEKDAKDDTSADTETVLTDHDLDTRDDRSMFEIMIDNRSETASVNFPAFETGGIVRSCLAFLLIEKEWEMIDKFLARGAVLNVTEIYVLVDVYLDLAYESDKDVDSMEFNILKKLMKQCHICYKNLMDQNGNNPIHKLFQNITPNANADVKHIGAVTKLLAIYSGWMLMENNDNKLGIEYLFDSMFPQQKSVNYKQVKNCNQLMQLLKNQYFISVYTKLTNRRMEEYPVCVSYLRMLLLFGCNAASIQERNTFVSLISHFEKIIFDENILGAVIVANSKDLTIDVRSSKSQLMVNKFVETNFAPKMISFDFLMKSLFATHENTNNNHRRFVNDSFVVMVGDARSPTPLAVPSEWNDFVQEEKMDVDNKNGQDWDVDENKTYLNDMVEENIDIDENERILAQLKQDEKENKKPLTWIELAYVLCVESLSCADLISDVIILSQLTHHRQVWWSVLSVIFMISPYLVSYTAMGSMLQNKWKNQRKHGKSSLLSLIIMTPLCLIYFFLLDVVFMIYAVFSSFIFLFSVGYIDIGDWMEEHFFYTILSVSRMELLGYRRLRTLAQLLFETFPSLILQVRILSVIGIDSNNTMNKYNVTPYSLFFSILFALLHMVFEGIIIKLDSSACNLSMYQYCIVCMNARLSWIPFANILTSKSIVDNNNFINTLSYHTSLNFENIVSKFLCLNYKLDFEFGKESWHMLMKYINNIVEYLPNSFDNSKNINQYRYNNGRDHLQLAFIDTKNLLAPLLADMMDNAKITNQEKLILLDQNQTLSAMPQIMKIRFGQKCCKNIDLFDMCELYQNASNRVIIDCQTVDWQRMIKVTRLWHSKSETRAVLENFSNILLSGGDVSSLIELNQARGFIDHQDTHFLFKQLLLQNIEFNILPLKKCHEKGIMYGMTCNESKKLYLMVYQMLRSQLESVDIIIEHSASNNSQNVNHGFIFESGQYFFTAMLLLFFTQSTIFGKNHRCYECGKDWIDHLQQYDNSFKNNSFDNHIDAYDIRDKIGQLFQAFLPKKIDISPTKHVILESVQFCHGLKKIFGDYLFKRAYFYSLAVGAISVGANTKILNDLSKQLKQDKSLKIQPMKAGTMPYDKLNLLTQFAKETTGQTEIGGESPLNGFKTRFKTIQIDDNNKYMNTNSSGMTFRINTNSDTIDVTNALITGIDVIFTSKTPVVNDNINIWDKFDKMFNVNGYLCWQMGKVSLGKAVVIPGNELTMKYRHIIDIEFSWNVKRIYNIQNNVDIDHSFVEINVDLLDEFFGAMNVNSIGIDTIRSTLFGSTKMECKIAYIDIDDNDDDKKENDQKDENDKKSDTDYYNANTNDNKDTENGGDSQNDDLYNFNGHDQLVEIPLTFESGDTVIVKCEPTIDAIHLIGLGLEARGWSPMMSSLFALCIEDRRERSFVVWLILRGFRSCRSDM